MVHFGIIRNLPAIRLLVVSIVLVILLFNEASCAKDEPIEKQPLNPRGSSRFQLKQQIQTQAQLGRRVPSPPSLNFKVTTQSPKNLSFKPVQFGKPSRLSITTGKPRRQGRINGAGRRNKGQSPKCGSDPKKWGQRCCLRESGMLEMEYKRVEQQGLRIDRQKSPRIYWSTKNRICIRYNTPQSATGGKQPGRIETSRASNRKQGGRAVPGRMCVATPKTVTKTFRSTSYTALEIPPGCVSG